MTSSRFSDLSRLPPGWPWTSSLLTSGMPSRPIEPQCSRLPKASLPTPGRSRGRLRVRDDQFLADPPAGRFYTLLLYHLVLTAGYMIRQ